MAGIIIAPPPPPSFDQARASRPFFQRYGGTGGRAAVCPVGLRATVPVPRWYFCQPLASRPSRPATGLGNHRWYRGDRDDGTVERGFALLCSARKCISSSPPNNGARICGPSPPYTKGWCLALAYLIICGRASFSPPSPPYPCSQQLSASGVQKAQQALSTASRHSTPAVWMRYLGASELDLASSLEASQPGLLICAVCHVIPTAILIRRNLILCHQQPDTAARTQPMYMIGME